MKITELERKVMQGIVDSEFQNGSDGRSPIWSWSIRCDVAKKSIPGVVSSLVKKQLAYCDGEGKDACVALTDVGIGCLADASLGSESEVKLPQATKRSQQGEKEMAVFKNRPLRIRLLTKKNPYREGSIRHARFEAYKKVKLVEQLPEFVKGKNLRFDEEKGLIKLI